MCGQWFFPMAYFILLTISVSTVSRCISPHPSPHLTFHSSSSTIHLYNPPSIPPSTSPSNGTGVQRDKRRKHSCIFNQHPLNIKHRKRSPTHTHSLAHSHREWHNRWLDKLYRSMGKRVSACLHKCVVALSVITLLPRHGNASVHTEKEASGGNSYRHTQCTHMLAFKRYNHNRLYVLPLSFPFLRAFEVLHNKLQQQEVFTGPYWKGMSPTVGERGREGGTEGRRGWTGTRDGHR